MQTNQVIISFDEYRELTNAKRAYDELEREFEKRVALPSIMLDKKQKQIDRLSGQIFKLQHQGLNKNYRDYLAHAHATLKSVQDLASGYGLLNKKSTLDEIAETVKRYFDAYYGYN